MSELDPFIHNHELVALVRTSGLSIDEVLHRFNARQARPLAKRTLQTYLANASAKTRIPCPEKVLMRMRAVLKRETKEHHGGLP